MEEEYKDLIIYKIKKLYRRLKEIEKKIHVHYHDKKNVVR